MSTHKKVINLGVVLEAGPDAEEFNRTLAGETDLDRVIMPKDVDQMLRYFRKLARDGVKVRKLVLMAHGSQYGHKIGMMGPEDVNFKNIQGFREERFQTIGNIEDEIKKLDADIAAASDKAQKEKLKQQRDEQKDRLHAVAGAYAEGTAREKLLVDVEDLMDKDAVIGLVNCYAASDAQGKTFMGNLGNVLLSKNGGRVVGCEGAVWTPRPVVSECLALSSTYAFSLAGWHTVKVKATGKTRHRCGAASRNFQRYGFCDHPASVDGGPCWQHR